MIMVSVAVSSGASTINDLSLSKDTVRRNCNRIREQTAQSIFEKTWKQFNHLNITDIYCLGTGKCRKI